MHTYCLINGDFRKTSEPVLKINDLGLLRGYGVFDFFPVKSAEPVFFNEYWSRFSHSARQMHLPVECEQDIFESQLHELILKNGFTDGYCRVLLTGGYSANGFLPDGSPNFLVTTQGPIHYPEKHYKEGIKLITLEYAREYPQIKSINYMTVLLERDRLREEEAEDVLYLSGDHITESSRSNFFIIDENGKLKTPNIDILAGITRSKVLEAASGLMEVQMTDISLHEAKLAQTTFITSTTKGIMPVTRIDDAVVNNGDIHPLIGELRVALEVKVNDYIRSRSKITS